MRDATPHHGSPVERMGRARLFCVTALAPVSIVSPGMDFPGHTGPTTIRDVMWQALSDQVRAIRFPQRRA